MSGVAFDWSSVLADLPWLAHGVSQRTRGVSAAPFDSLNLGLHVGDDPNAVRENRRRATEALGFSLTSLVCAEQVHGAEVAVVGVGERGRGATDFSTALVGADALVTNTSGVLLGLYFADCVPILFADPETRAIGIAHAGWRGLVGGVIQNTVATIHEKFGTVPETLRVGVGPCIGPEHFEVGPEVATQFPAEVVQTLGYERPHVNLKAAIEIVLGDCGISRQHRNLFGGCTYTDSARYFSHRRDAGKTGRMGAFIGIPETAP